MTSDERSATDVVPSSNITSSASSLISQGRCRAKLGATKIHQSRNNTTIRTAKTALHPSPSFNSFTILFLCEKTKIKEWAFSILLVRKIRGPQLCFLFRPRALVFHLFVSSPFCQVPVLYTLAAAKNNTVNFEQILSIQCSFVFASFAA